MRVIVDRSLCDDHSQCEIAAPEVFRIAEDGRLAFDEQPDEAHRAAVADAADACPVQAILIEG